MLVPELEKKLWNDGLKGGARLLKQVKNPNERLLMIVFIL
jgi:hypothetical protein